MKIINYVPDNHIELLQKELDDYNKTFVLFRKFKTKPENTSEDINKYSNILDSIKLLSSSKILSAKLSGVYVEFTISKQSNEASTFQLRMTNIKLADVSNQSSLEVTSTKVRKNIQLYLYLPTELYDRYNKNESFDIIEEEKKLINKDE